MTPWLAPVTLEGRLARLEPLAQHHQQGLTDAVQDGDLWNLWFTAAPSPDAMAQRIADQLAKQAAGTCLPFVVIDQTSGAVVGSTTYMNVDPAQRRVEIGSTWYAKRVQKTLLNTECKLMLMRHAFEALDCIAVEYRTHFFNHNSRRAIERLGAKLDGILRNHVRDAQGNLRDTCVYSIIAGEWPTVRQHLTWKLAQDRS